MSTAEAAVRLGVSQRQVQRLVAAGHIAKVRTVGRCLLVDAADVVSLAELSRRQGRPWSHPVAWAALWRLSGLKADWLDAQADRRIGRRLADTSIDALLWACRGRAAVTKYRASASFLNDIRRVLASSGPCGLDQSRDLMAPALDRADGYCTSLDRDRLVKDCFLVADPRGNVTLRTTDFPAVNRWEGVMPVAVVAVDLAESSDPREASIGQHLLKESLHAPHTPT
jgi:excisionase family DNA binding protein